MISIITPVYNGDRFIESCIKVVIDQACSDIEHIIVDGGSTDRTLEIVQHYAEKYPHIRWISEKDRGQSDAMNKGIALAKHKIIGFFNVDDYYEPNVLNRVKELFQNLPEPTLLVGNCNVWLDSGKLKYVNKPSKLKLVQLLAERNFPVNPVAYFYHKSLHEKIGLYSLEEKYVMDVIFIFEAVQAATVKYVDETWGNYRYITGSKTYDNVSESFQNYDRIVSQYINKLSPIEKVLLVWEYLNIRLRYFIEYPDKLSSSIKVRLNKIFGQNSPKNTK
ncbi:glycosyltransferase family 2 protein [Floridanema evergladense]|uniref:Glycosyltransferase family 2 protein n=1 Tax=Floridaenema evergladense BLCC-F167 TaxID=3153639 RepID=A0ABV4WN04_9CYAN